MSKLREILDNNATAKTVAADQKQKQEAERLRIRAKLSDTDREFLDRLREVFPSARMVGIRFKDGEQVGRL